jgi:hypothetical protein
MGIQRFSALFVRKTKRARSVQGRAAKDCRNRPAPCLARCERRRGHRRAPKRKSGRRRKRLPRRRARRRRSAVTKLGAGSDFKKLGTEKKRQREEEQRKAPSLVIWLLSIGLIRNLRVQLMEPFRPKPLASTANAEKFETCTPIHLPFNSFESVDLALRLSGAP